jgi:V-type H+-transporting ATPase subunit a
LKGLNHLYFKEKLAFIFEFIPQLIMFVSLFGYTVVMIFIKWSTNWDIVGTSKAPSIINLLLDIFIKMGEVVSLFYLFN